MVKAIFFTVILFSCLLAAGQNRNDPPPPGNPIQASATNKSIPQEPYFDFYKDFQNYATGKVSKYKALYDKYTKVDSTPVYIKMTRKEKEYPSPCFRITGENMVQTGMMYDYLFLLQIFQKDLICLKNGNAYDPEFMKYQAFDYLLSASTEESFNLLDRHEKNTFSEKQLNVFFEEAKMHFRKGQYEKSNALFAFLATVNEDFREAALNNVGLSFYNKKEYERALVYFEKTMALYPKGYLGYLNAGACIAKMPVDMGDVNESSHYFKKAFELAPDNPNAIFNYANALDQYSTQGVDLQTLKQNLFAKSARLDENQPLFKYKYAASLHKRAQDNRYDEELFSNALNAYNESINLFPDYADNYKGKAKLFSLWSGNKNFPGNRILRDSACKSLQRYKTLSAEKYDTNLDRLCTVFPKIDGNHVRDYKALLPNNWEEVSITKGDLNKDGVEDIVLLAREVNAGKLKNIIRYNTPNHEKGTRNYNRVALYVLLHDVTKNNFEIIAVEDQLPEPDESYYDKAYDVQIKNGTFRLSRKENPQAGAMVEIFRLEADKFVCIGINQTMVKDGLGNVAGSAVSSNLPIEKFNVSYNFNTQIMEIKKESKASKKDDPQIFKIAIEKYALEDAHNKHYKVYQEAEKILKKDR